MRALIAGIYVLALVPYVGLPLVVLGSSGFYYVWRAERPKEAAMVNRHAWTAWLLAMLVTLAWRYR